METSLTIDNQLLETAFRIGGLKTPKETISIALEEFIRKRKMDELISMFHTVNYDSGYNYKELRHRK
jgi:Arc/MetJ family transcription regulator